MYKVVPILTKLPLRLYLHQFLDNQHYVKSTFHSSSLFNFSIICTCFCYMVIFYVLKLSMSWKIHQQIWLGPQIWFLKKSFSTSLKLTLSSFISFKVFLHLFLAKLLFWSLVLSRSVKLVLFFFLSQFGLSFFKSD